MQAIDNNKRIYFSVDTDQDSDVNNYMYMRIGASVRIV